MEPLGVYCVHDTMIKVIEYLAGGLVHRLARNLLLEKLSGHFLHQLNTEGGMGANPL